MCNKKGWVEGSFRSIGEEKRDRARCLVNTHDVVAAFSHDLTLEDLATEFLLPLKSPSKQVVRARPLRTDPSVVFKRKGFCSLIRKAKEAAAHPSREVLSPWTT